jgi:hypothetical protein
MDPKYKITVSEIPTVLVDNTVHLFIDNSNTTQEYKGNRSKSFDTHLSVMYTKKRSMSS